MSHALGRRNRSYPSAPSAAKAKHLGLCRTRLLSTACEWELQHLCLRSSAALGCSRVQPCRRRGCACSRSTSTGCSSLARVEVRAAGWLHQAAAEWPAWVRLLLRLAMQAQEPFRLVVDEISQPGLPAMDKGHGLAPAWHGISYVTGLSCIKSLLNFQQTITRQACHYTHLRHLNHHVSALQCTHAHFKMHVHHPYITKFQHHQSAHPSCWSGCPSL